MSDNIDDDDFDTDDFDTEDFGDEGFDDLGEEKGTLGDLWRNNPLVKIGIILVALAVLVGGIVLFGGSSTQTPSSRVAVGADVTETPGSAETSENFRLAVEEENVRRTEEAIRQNQSSIPTPIDPPKGTLPIQFQEEEQEDPLERWRRMQEERIRQQQVNTAQQQAAPVVAPTPVQDTRTPVVNALSGAMAQQMESILSNQNIEGATVQDVAAADYIQNLREQEREAAQQEIVRQQELQTGNTAIDDLNIILPAGTIEYAQMVTEANTDAPGPILAEIVTGPLRGARVIGLFEEEYNFLTLNFNTIILDGVDFEAEGVAIDPDTTLPGLVTEIDRRYMTRVILPTAAAFVTGLTEAISESGSTTIVIDGNSVSETTDNDDLNNDQEVASGIEEAGEELSDILDEISDEVKPMLRVAAGTPIGILFVEPVVGTPKVIDQRNLQAPSTGVDFSSNFNNLFATE